jgi:hypothetical protein
MRTKRTGFYCVAFEAPAEDKTTTNAGNVVSIESTKVTAA